MHVSKKARRSGATPIYERLFACSPDAIVVVDGEGRIAKVNPQVEDGFETETKWAQRIRPCLLVMESLSIRMTGRPCINCSRLPTFLFTR
jgi:PAS domain-containing protein